MHGSYVQNYHLDTSRYILFPGTRYFAWLKMAPFHDVRKTEYYATQTKVFSSPQTMNITFIRPPRWFCASSYIFQYTNACITHLRGTPTAAACTDWSGRVQAHKWYVVCCGILITWKHNVLVFVIRLHHYLQLAITSKIKSLTEKSKGSLLELKQKWIGPNGQTISQFIRTCRFSCLWFRIGY